MPQGIRRPHEAVDYAALTRMYPPTLPDLFQGDEIVVKARVRGSGPLSLQLTGRDASGPVRMNMAVIDVDAKTGLATGIRRLTADST